MAIGSRPDRDSPSVALIGSEHYSHGMSSSCEVPDATSSNYDVTADGRRFLMIQNDDAPSTSSSTFVLMVDFVNELGRRTA